MYYANRIVPDLCSLPKCLEIYVPGGNALNVKMVEAKFMLGLQGYFCI